MNNAILAIDARQLTVAFRCCASWGNYALHRGAYEHPCIATGHDFTHKIPDRETALRSPLLWRAREFADKFYRSSEPRA